MSERLMEIDHVSKEYRLGAIGGGTLRGDLQSWYARIRGKEDPNRKIGSMQITGNPRFMALDDVSFNVNRCDALGIVGRNGAGKSTILKLISRITAPTKGEIRIRGRVASLLEIGTGFHPELTGRENIFLNGAILGMGRAETARKLDEIIAFSEIEQFIDTPVKRYSSGMYVKLAFAVAAHLDPDVLICDEVLAVGDLAFQQKCLTKMSEIAAGGCAVLYVSHNMRTIDQLCNRAVFLDHGKLLYDGTVEQAVNLYSGGGERTAVRDLEPMMRGRDRGFSMHMEKLEFLGSDLLEYHMDDEMEFVLTARSAVDAQGLRLRFILKTPSQNVLGMTQSPTIDVKKGEQFRMHLRFPLTGVAPGEYAIKLSLIDGRPGGKSGYYDTIEDVGRFIVLDDINAHGGFAWQERLWGNFRLGEMETVE